MGFTEKTLFKGGGGGEQVHEKIIQGALDSLPIQGEGAWQDRGGGGRGGLDTLIHTMY